MVKLRRFSEISATLSMRMAMVESLAEVEDR
jgi:hypothetical protein